MSSCCMEKLCCDLWTLVSLKSQYCIVGNVCERENFRKVVKNVIFTEKTFADCWLCRIKEHHVP